jgi:sporulation protein YlmC with PRC-barrel domain
VAGPVEPGEHVKELKDAHDEDRLTGTLDAVLHLLDRQVVDPQDHMVCKVDDVELTDFGDGVLGVSGLLAGPAALVPRLGDQRSSRRLMDLWRRLGRPEADREDPYRIDLELVDRLGSAVELKVGAEGALVRQGQQAHRLNELLQMPVQDRDGVRLGRVLDVRLEADASDPGNRIRVIGLVVGRGRPGSYFGYDRRPDMGPWMVRTVVRWLHRHSAYVDLDDLDELDWDAGVIRVDRGRLQTPKAVGG